MFKNASLYSLIFAASLLVLSSAHAERKFTPLENGMAYQDVLRVWGEPAEREEQESKRGDVWTYPGNVKVFFKEGKVIAWSGIENPAPNKAELKELKEARAPGRAEASGKSVDDLLSEILNEVPDLGEGSGSGSQAGGPSPLSGVVVPPPMPLPPPANSDD
jgi:hypothetical protein